MTADLPCFPLRTKAWQQWRMVIEFDDDLKETGLTVDMSKMTEGI